MRGLVMALLALDLPGSDGAMKANRRAGGFGAPFLSIASSGTTKAKTIATKTTGKTV